MRLEFVKAGGLRSHLLRVSLFAPLLMASPVAAQGNFLILLADDLGSDVVDTAGPPGEYAAPTPSLYALAARGVTFSKAWAHPLCSPSRASLLTGLSPLVHGIGTNVGNVGGLDAGRVTIADLAHSRGYDTFAIGKWHLAGTEQDMRHPLAMGFDHHAGTRAHAGRYDAWDEYVDGEGPTRRTGYATSVTVDRALERIRTAGDRPWLGYVAFHAPHSPFHVPPESLHGYELQGAPEEDRPRHYRAAVEALDSEIGRLIASIPRPVLEQTTILFAGDNGTPKPAKLPVGDKSRAKGSVYRWGVEVPFIVAGAAVSPALRGSVSDAPVQLEDVFATIAASLGRADAIPRGAHSFLAVLNGSGRSQRTRHFAHHFSPTRDRHAVQQGCFKLLRPGLGRAPEFYDRCRDPEERTPLDASARSLAPAASEAFRELSRLLPAPGAAEASRALARERGGSPPQTADGESSGAAAVDPRCGGVQSWHAPAIVGAAIALGLGIAFLVRRSRTARGEGVDR